jgi:hypothetical protein
MKIKNEIERQREVDEMRMTKWRTDSIYFPHDLNTHDPHEQYAWADENLPWWAWAFRLLGGVVFLASIGLLIFAGLLL